MSKNISIVAAAIIILAGLYFMNSTPKEYGVTNDTTVAYFTDKGEEKIDEKVGKPSQGVGYIGPMFLQAFPGIIPQDFVGVNTNYGSYGVTDGKLSFMGNAPSNAMEMNKQGMTKLLQNLFARLSIEAKDTEGVDKILKKISL